MVEEKKPAAAAEKQPGKSVGKITHFFGKIEVAIVELTDTLKVNDKIAIRGATTDIEQTVDSIELDHKKIEEAKKGDAIGLSVKDKVREGDEIFKL
ncbi:MAG: hypothetical protein CEN89_451 [Candidatus Berkelbacteria bacterium Licking1014_7]|uniref:Translation elongation factor-like protein n=1 Tax=Candidatus Berkelbacteria bacterium Licking1014_7 TaxID=2017147 RepID=A0A554LIX6_9BACT|nr:MAG: hypothetical protein CEN89_451 [Candidatus Berkelbacteria bacterium Licking1014_7]